MRLKKNIYLLCCLVALLTSCQEDTLQGENTGYLRLQMDINTYVDTKAYDPEQIAVQIVSADGEVVEETSDWTEWQGKQIALAVGTYTLKASSAGFDGNSGLQPYYAGSQTINIEKDKEVNTKITCTLANVKVTVKFDDSFKKHFTSAQVTVDDLAGSSAINPQTFNMDFDADKSVYFPVTDLSALVQVKNQQGETHQQTNEITGVKARDHYILTYKVGEGEGDVNITVDPSYKTYEYTFTIPTEPSTQLATPTVNAWAKFAYVSGSVISSEDELDAENMVFQYRKKNTENWTSVNAKEESNSSYSATLSPLDANSTYECRMAYNDAEFTSQVREFTTEEATALYNGDFESWSQSGSTIYPDIASNAGNTSSFWNTSNPGTSQGLGAIGGAVNPTTSTTNPVHKGSYAAKLQSTDKLSVFAAASLYTGNFLGLDGMSANMEFGKPFTARPIALHGYYQYTPSVINKVDRYPSGVTIVKDETMDECAIYIALAKKSFTFNNKEEDTYIDYINDNNIIAYGELPSGTATTESEYKEFNIPLKYKSLTDKPTHIIIVCSASKYGDYMTGGIGSTLYVDDFELIYDYPAQ